MLLSLSIAVYNRPDVLRMVLLSCARQSLRNFEIIVADDGSSSAVASIVEEVRRSTSLEIVHLWHADKGWRKNIMLNNAIRSARTDYMVFIDGDCLLHHRFLEDHWREHRRGVTLCGRRVELGERWGLALSPDAVVSGRFERMGVREWWDAITGRGQRIEDGLRLRSSRLSKWLHPGVPRMLGSNFSIYRSDLELVNGFDERYIGPGFGEDSDIQFRLELAGITCSGLRNSAIQYHVHHGRTHVSASSEALFRETVAEGHAVCRDGLVHIN